MDMNMDDVDSDDVKILLTDAWGISGRHDLNMTLDQLLAGQQQNLFDELVEKNKLSRMPLSEFVMQSRVARSLEGMNQDDYTVLVNEATSASLRWAQDGIIGWDWARYVHLLRLAFLAELLDSDESWKLLKNLEQPIKSRFKNWDSFGKSYLNGRTFWQGTASPMDDVISRLNTDPWSPWKKFGWL
ncbi:MAG: DUF1266 domain-containing protein [Bdellovibrionaceae bacterium]|nr:DUF1266 domain-containing protein [Pseudobdellovibrionaceae bacterium]